jgi:AraC-like DNA-binding protein
MSVVFRAVDAPVGVREDYWRHVIEEQLGPMELRPAAALGAATEFAVGDLGPLRVTRISTGPGEARRSARHVRRVGSSMFQLFVGLRGTAWGGHGADLDRLAPGDLSLIDLSRPYRCVYPAHRTIAVTFPPSLVPLPRAGIARLAGVSIPGGAGTAALVSALVRRLPRHLDYSGVATARVGTAVLDLLTATLAERLDRESAIPADTGRRVLLARIHGFIEARLPDPELTPAVVAEAHHISVRYLHRLFENDGYGVAGLIRQRRLERCRADLLDPALSGRPAAAVGARWGFASPAHFSRVFRETYGLPPGEYRLAHSRADADPDVSA